MPDIALASVVICRLRGPVSARIGVDIFHRDHAGPAIYSIQRMGRTAETISGLGLPTDGVIGDACGMPAHGKAREVHHQRIPFGRSADAL